MDKAYSAKLKNRTLETFRAHLDSFPLSFFGKGAYGRCSKGARPPENMFSYNTTFQVKEEKFGFHYFYIDKERGDTVARVTAVDWGDNELSINIAWDEQAAGNYIGNLIFSIKHFHKSVLIDSSGSQKIDKRLASAVGEQSPSQQKSKSGRPKATGLTANLSAIERLQQGERKEKNFYQWRYDYQEETGIDPELKKAGARELYRKSVWAVYQKQTGK